MAMALSAKGKEKPVSIMTERESDSVYLSESDDTKIGSAAFNQQYLDYLIAMGETKTIARGCELAICENRGHTLTRSCIL
jgi:hypothetical protein